MLISRRWLCRHFATPPGDSSVIADALVQAGFPVESVVPLPDGDARLDVEITSNRGDCLSHAGLAREVAAKLGLRLISGSAGTAPVIGGASGPACAVHIEAPNACPRFTARVLSGVRVGPSPAWLREALEAIGQRSINNIVDVTNYICAEFGNPCHVFDLARLTGGTLIVRHARPGEKLTTLDGKERPLSPDDVVVADAERAQSLAGVMGGQLSQVTDRTTDVVLEMATWDPVAVRLAARRHQLRTDASHRFERIVDARSIDQAAERAAALIIEVGGGGQRGGVIDAGVGLAAKTRIRFRPSRCRALLGFDLPASEMIELLGRLEVESAPNGRAGEELICTVPVFRPDLTREVDLIEEVGRLKGLDAVPRHATIPVALTAPQASETARRQLAAILTGLGSFECVSFSFTSAKEAALFLPPGAPALQVYDDRRGGESTLRPSVLTGLLAARRKNQHGLVRAEGGVRLHEIAAAFSPGPPEAAVPGVDERLTLGLLIDVPAAGRTATVAELQKGVRWVRGAIEELVNALAGAGLEIEPAAPHCAAYDDAAFARVRLGGAALGCFGLVSRAGRELYDLPTPVVAAELDLQTLIAGYPPRATVAPLPAFPGIERDLSLVLPEPVRWAAVEQAVRAHASPPFEAVAFVGVYRGAQAGAGKKSVTLRLSFRDPAHTLRHEEVDAPVAALVGVLGRQLGAEVRS